jgi:hypothetical protein
MVEVAVEEVEDELELWKKIPPEEVVVEELDDVDDVKLELLVVDVVDDGVV